MEPETKTAKKDISGPSSGGNAAENNAQNSAAAIPSTPPHQPLNDNNDANIIAADPVAIYNIADQPDDMVVPIQYESGGEGEYSLSSQSSSSSQQGSSAAADAVEVEYVEDGADDYDYSRYLEESHRDEIEHSSDQENLKKLYMPMCDPRLSTFSLGFGNAMGIIGVSSAIFLLVIICEILDGKIDAEYWGLIGIPIGLFDLFYILMFIHHYNAFARYQRIKSATPVIDQRLYNYRKKEFFSSLFGNVIFFFLLLWVQVTIIVLLDDYGSWKKWKSHSCTEGLVARHKKDTFSELECKWPAASCDEFLAPDELASVADCVISYSSQAAQNRANQIASLDYNLEFSAHLLFLPIYIMLVSILFAISFSESKGALSIIINAFHPNTIARLFSSPSSNLAPFVYASGSGASSTPLYDNIWRINSGGGLYENSGDIQAAGGGADYIDRNSEKASAEMRRRQQSPDIPASDDYIYGAEESHDMFPDKEPTKREYSVRESLREPSERGESDEEDNGDSALMV